MNKKDEIERGSDVGKLKEEVMYEDEIRETKLR